MTKQDHMNMKSFYTMLTVYHGVVLASEAN